MYFSIWSFRNVSFLILLFQKCLNIDNVSSVILSRIYRVCLFQQHVIMHNILRTYFLGDLGGAKNQWDWVQNVTKTPTQSTRIPFIKTILESVYCIRCI